MNNTFQLTLANNTILKCFKSNENQSLKNLTLEFLESDYSISELTTLFQSDDIKNIIKRIYKFTPDGISVCTFENYTVVRSIAIGIDKIEADVSITVPSINSDSQSVNVDITEPVEQNVNVIVVILDYENPMILEVENLRKELIQTKKDNDMAIAELTIALANISV